MIIVSLKYGFIYKINQVHGGKNAKRVDCYAWIPFSSSSFSTSPPPIGHKTGGVKGQRIYN